MLKERESAARLRSHADGKSPVYERARGAAGPIVRVPDGSSARPRTNEIDVSIRKPIGAVLSRWIRQLEESIRNPCPAESHHRADTEPEVCGNVGSGHCVLAAKQLEQQGLQFNVNVEIGNMTVGSAACCGTKESAFPGGYGQVNSYLVGAKLVLASGELLEVTEPMGNEKSAGVSSMKQGIPWPTRPWTFSGERMGPAGTATANRSTSPRTRTSKNSGITWARWNPPAPKPARPGPMAGFPSSFPTSTML